MKEETLRQFFEGTVDEQDLLADLENTVTKGQRLSQYRIEDMSTDYTVTADHIFKLCNAFLGGALNSEHLRAIGFCLEASDTFEWDSDVEDGRRVADVVFYISSPEINYELNDSNIGKFKEILENGSNPFEKST